MQRRSIQSNATDPVSGQTWKLRPHHCFTRTIKDTYEHLDFRFIAPRLPKLVQAYTYAKAASACDKLSCVMLCAGWDLLNVLRSTMYYCSCQFCDVLICQDVSEMDFWMFFVHLGSVRPSLAASHRLGSEFEGKKRKGSPFIGSSACFLKRLFRAPTRSDLVRILGSGALTRPLPFVPGTSLVDGVHAGVFDGSM